MNSKLSPSLIICVSFVLFGCHLKDKESDRSAKIDATYNQIADLTIEQLKITNAAFEDSKVTAAIKEYGNARTAIEKDGIISKAIPDVTFTLPAPNERKKNGGLEFISFPDKVSPNDFDLAIRNNDVVVKQVKLMNAYFAGLDTGTVSAIAFYENLPKDDKIKYFLDYQQLKPLPDFQKIWIRREFQRAYLLQRLLLLERLRMYMVRTKYINEFPQGFKQNTGVGYQNNDKQFDLALIEKK
ncbi:MAG: hypothetical protein JWQ09_4447 [Segetibacter sp.]|nr:hypothetical protein [Segetibacter sp.]